jgi:SNF2 family DNA or RNA helicase
MQKVTTFKWVARPQALDICKQVLQPSVRFSLDECIDIPSTNYVGREVSLTPIQERAFEKMREDCAIILSGGEVITAANAAVMFGKLLQIACGVVYDEDGSHVEIDSHLRYEGLKELIDEIGGKVIVYVPFRGVQYDLRTKLIADGYDVELVNGEVSKTDRDAIFHDFQNNPNRQQVLLAHPKVASHGLTLTAANSIIWFAPVYSLESYEQANARIRRLNTTGKTSVFHLYATDFERELYKRLQTKKRVLSDFLEMVRGYNQ